MICVGMSCRCPGALMTYMNPLKLCHLSSISHRCLLLIFSVVEEISFLKLSRTFQTWQGDCHVKILVEKLVGGLWLKYSQTSLSFRLCSNRVWTSILFDSTRLYAECVSNSFNWSWILDNNNTSSSSNTVCRNLHATLCSSLFLCFLSIL